MQSCKHALHGTTPTCMASPIDVVHASMQGESSHSCPQEQCTVRVQERVKKDECFAMRFIMLSFDRDHFHRDS